MLRSVVVVLAALVGVGGLSLGLAGDSASVMPPAPTAQPGDVERGRRIALDRQRGDCVICHAMPLPERRFHGTLGLPLDGVGSRYSAAELRLRLVNPKLFNPATIMPAYATTRGLHRVLERYRGKPILNAQ